MAGIHPGAGTRSGRRGSSEALGSIFLLLVITPYAGPILAIVGLVLALLAVIQIADFVGDRAIPNNVIAGVALAAGGILVGVLLVFTAMWRFMGLGMMAGPNFNPMTAPPSEFWGFMAAMVGGLLATWAFFLVSAVFMKRTFDAIGTKLNVPMFETAALVYLIGAALAVVLVGFFVIFVAEILFAVAFFSIPEDGPRQVAATA